MKDALMIIFLLFTFSSSVQAAKIIDFQPNCTPQLLESIDLIEPLQSVNGAVSAQTKEAMRRNMLLELVELAKEKQAEAIILDNVKVMLPESKKTGKSAVTQFRMKMVAQFVNLCGDDKTLSKNVTPFNHEGNRQMELGGLSFKQQQIVIRQPGTEQKNIPALQSALISLETGVYGAYLGATQSKIIDLFGFPTAEFQLDNTTKLMAYGRNHWFYFKKNELVKITSENLHLNRNLINLVPFDDRFDDALWQLYQRFTKNTKQATFNLSQEKIGNLASHQLLPVWRSNNAQENVLNGFNYSIASFVDPILTFTPQTKNYGWLIALLDQDSDQRQSELDKLTNNAIGKIYIDRVTISYVVDEYMRLNLVNGKLRDIIIGDRLFRYKDVLKSRYSLDSKSKPESMEHSLWQLGDIRQESRLETVLTLSSNNGVDMDNNALQTGDTLTISHTNYNLKYQFYEQQNQLRLFQLHFSVF